MFTSNPFATLPAFISPAIMQTYIVVMIILVAAGTIYDVLHKKSARFFRENMRKSEAAATRKVGGGEMVSLAIKTAVVDVAADFRRDVRSAVELQCFHNAFFVCDRIAFDAKRCAARVRRFAIDAREH